MPERPKYPTSELSVSLCYNRELADFLDRIARNQHIPQFRLIIKEAAKRIRSIKE